MDLAEHSCLTNWGDYKSNWITANQINFQMCSAGRCVLSHFLMCNKTHCLVCWKGQILSFAWMLKDSTQCCYMISQEPTILTPFEAENIPRDGYSSANSIRFDFRPCYKVIKRLISDHWKQRNGKTLSSVEQTFNMRNHQWHIYMFLIKNNT